MELSDTHIFHNYRKKADLKIWTNFILWSWVRAVSGGKSKAKIPSREAMDANSAPEIQPSAESRPLRKKFAINGVQKGRSLRYAWTVHQIGGLRRIFRNGRPKENTINSLIRSSSNCFQIRVFVLRKESLSTLLPQSFLSEGVMLCYYHCLLKERHFCNVL